MTRRQTSSDSTQSSPVKHQPRGPGQQSASPTASVREPPPSDVGGDSGSGEKVFGSPFDRFRPVGGGADRDIFRRFNIRAAEEADFLIFWADKRISAGIFARDANGTLVFRISSAHQTDLNELDIGNPGAWNHFARWMHVYDAEGTSWLTQFRRIDVEALPKIFDGAGQPVEHDGRLGLYGLSGLTIREFVARQRIEAELARITG